MAPERGGASGLVREAFVAGRNSGAWSATRRSPAAARRRTCGAAPSPRSRCATLVAPTASLTYHRATIRTPTMHVHLYRGSYRLSTAARSASEPANMCPPISCPGVGPPPCGEPRHRAPGGERWCPGGARIPGVGKADRYAGRGGRRGERREGHAGQRRCEDYFPGDVGDQVIGSVSVAHGARSTPCPSVDLGGRARPVRYALDGNVRAAGNAMNAQERIGVPGPPTLRPDPPAIVDRRRMLHTRPLPSASRAFRSYRV